MEWMNDYKESKQVGMRNLEEEFVRFVGFNVENSSGADEGLFQQLFHVEGTDAQMNLRNIFLRKRIRSDNRLVVSFGSSHRIGAAVIVRVRREKKIILATRSSLFSKYFNQHRRTS